MRDICFRRIFVEKRPALQSRPWPSPANPSPFETAFSFETALWSSYVGVRTAPSRCSRKVSERGRRGDRNVEGLLFRPRDRIAQINLGRKVGATGLAAMQRTDRALERIAGPEAVGVDALSNHDAWRRAFEIPFPRFAVRVLDLDDQYGVRINKSEFLHRARDFNR